jgi:putative tricarboxylic transport membrane protein
MMHDLNPGPLLFTERPDIIYSLFAALAVANGVMLALGLLGSRLWVKVTSVPKKILFPMILVVSVIGSFAVNYSFFDVVSCLAFGLIGWIMKRYGFPVAPVVLGIVLGKLAEENFRRAVIMGGYPIFFTRPASLILLSIALVSFAYPLVRTVVDKRRSATK